MAKAFVTELVKGIVFQDYGDRATDTVFRFSRSEIANTLETAHGVVSYEGILDDIDRALFQLYGHGIEPCIGAGRAGALWKFGPGKPPRSKQLPLPGSPV
jgi:hypothetical protein